MQKLSIKIKNIIWVISFGIAPLIFAIGFLLHEADDNFEDSLADKMNIITEVVGNTIDNYRNIALSYRLGQFSSAFGKARNSEEAMISLGENNTLFKSFVLIRATGDKREIIHVKVKKKYRRYVWFEKGPYGDSLRSVFREKSGFDFCRLRSEDGKDYNPYLRFVKRVTVGDKKYFAVAFFDLIPIFEKKIPLKKQYRDYTFLFINNFGDIFFQHYGNDIKGKNASSVIPALVKEYLNTKNTVPHSSKSLITIRDKNDTGYFLVCRDFPNLKYKIVTLIAVSSAKKYFNEFFMFFGILLGIAIALTLGINYFSFSRVLKPLQEFQDVAEEVAAGNYDVRLSVNGDKEIVRYAQIFNRMLQDIKTKSYFNIDRILEEKTKLDKIMNGISDGVMVINSRKEIILANRTFCGWYEVDQKKIISKQIASLGKFSEYCEIADELLRLEKQQSEVREITLACDREEKTFHLIANKIVTSKGALIGISFLLRDITKTKELDKLKNETFSFVTHELRSPLVSIIGFSEFLVEDGLSEEERKEFQRIVLSESRRMLSFINDFLDLAKLEQGRSKMKMSTIDLKEFIGKRIINAKAAAEKNQIKIVTDFPNEPLRVFTFPQLLAIICDNYISNAIKYSPGGKEIYIRLRLKGASYFIEVEDQGFGIAREDQEKVFNKFYRTEKNPEIQGTGLGLSLVKNAAKILGGRVYLKSEPEKGSVFGAELPIKIPEFTHE
jgi:two-component system phosphate regulon sensor histidine kinase PhoR